VTSPIAASGVVTLAHRASSELLGMPYHSSKPWSVGKRPGVLPRCHSPKMAVA